MRILHLTLVKKYFDMIASGEKTEEYRMWKPYWIKRLLEEGMKDSCAVYAGNNTKWKQFDIIRFKNGYQKNAPEIDVEWKGVEFGIGKQEWGASGYKQFIIKLGNILSIKNYSDA